jgi:hypothetical protein
MVAGVTCPTDPAVSIDVLNCRDVGVSDGLQNLLYLGFWVLGSGFCDFVLRVSSTILGTFIPGTQNYMELTLNSFKTASETQKQRLTFCFWATLPTILLPLGILFLAGLAIALLIPPLLLLINALVTLFFASPAAAVVPGADASAWFGDEEEAPTATTTTTIRDRRKAQEQERNNNQATLGAWIRGAWFGREPRKLKKE